MKYTYGLMDVNHYWRNISSICNKEGKAKYQKLCTLVNCILILSLDNKRPERGFSIIEQQTDLLR